ncbi:hypothetical protein J7438_17145 [Thalassotalea sp. G20_0]|uniref:hypothetical protein n=1 Tax=Thalassotalea sp. G20_0 TaxID=2821093 RepID=UPI001ADB3E97|nr:hypothetical protein [Thalassotalea sp. G20_0]MBO9495802.1 hypothetical protein [Thalassotalea sp. G20_0]
MNCLYDGAAAIGSAVAYVLKQPLRLISYFCGRVVAGLSAVKKKLFGTVGESQPSATDLSQRSVSIPMAGQSPVTGEPSVMVENTDRSKPAAGHDANLKPDPGSPVNFPQCINIGFLGASSGGKSALINLLRDVDVNATDAARETVVRSKQRDTKRYRLNKTPVYLCELPEIKADYNPEAMANRSGLLAYDAVIVPHCFNTVRSDALATMISQVKEAGIPLYFVYTKMDNAIASIRSEERKSSPSFYQDLATGVKAQIKRNFQHAIGSDFSDDNIFISGFPSDSREFDVPQLKQLLGNVQKRAGNG